ncbi:MAG: MFS transporter [bacterium]
MLDKIKQLGSSFFCLNLKREIKELYASIFILNFALSAVNLFEPVFIYLLFAKSWSVAQAVQGVLLYYLSVYLIYFFVVPLGAKFAKRFGFEHSIALGSVFTVLLYLTLFASQQNFWFLGISVLCYIASKSFFWPAYHADFAYFATDGAQGKQISNLSVLDAIVFVLGPLFGGLVLNYFGFNVLFLIASIIILLSNVPMLLTKEQFTPSEFSYREAFSTLFDKKHRRRFFAHLGFGEELIVLVVWPIFIYIVVADFLKLGTLAAVAVLITTIVSLYVGKIIDGRDKQSVMRYGVFFYVLAWFFRLLSRTIYPVFAVDTLSRVAKQVIAIPFVAFTYQKANDGHHVMRAVVFFEMALVFGKILALILSLVIFQFIEPGWNAVFILAGLFTTLYLLL